MKFVINKKRNKFLVFYAITKLATTFGIGGFRKQNILSLIDIGLMKITLHNLINYERFVNHLIKIISIYRVVLYHSTSFTKSIYNIQKTNGVLLSYSKRRRNCSFVQHVF